MSWIEHAPRLGNQVRVVLAKDGYVIVQESDMPLEESERSDMDKEHKQSRLSHFPQQKYKPSGEQ